MIQWMLECVISSLCLLLVCILDALLLYELCPGVMNLFFGWQVQKKGSVGRSIDVTGFKNYDELCSAIECMFGLEGLLNDPRGSGWKLVYVDYENDVLLVGDDPWEWVFFSSLWWFICCSYCLHKYSVANSVSATKHAWCLCRQFVRCVRCIKILSPTEVQKMSEEGMKLLNSAAMQGV